MFGLNQFTWGQFLMAMAVILVLWYVGLFTYALFTTRKSNGTFLFEEESDEKLINPGYTPIRVSASEYPSELIPLQVAEDIPLPQTFFEGSGIDDGYPLDQFQGTGEALSTGQMEQIQFYK